MSFLNILTALLLAACVFARPQFKHCTDSEVECRRERMKLFFTEFSAGNADLEIKSMDPMIIDEISVPEETLNLMFRYKNLKITGLKDIIIQDFSKEKHSNVAHMNTKFNYVADGLIDVEFIKNNKVLSGKVNYEAGVIATMSYSFSTNTENGKEVPEIGPETITCECTNVKSTINEELKKTFETDPVSQPLNEDYQKIHSQYQAKVACEIAKAMFKIVAENLRAIVKNEKY